MTASEFIFLALGLVLGVTAGAALVEFLRARPPVAREVRLTVSQDAIPRRRSSTLADGDSGGMNRPAAEGGPADPLGDGVAVPVGEVDHRTAVHVPGPMRDDLAVGRPEVPGIRPRVHDGPGDRPALIAVPVGGRVDRSFQSFRSDLALAGGQLFGQPLQHAGGAAVLARTDRRSSATTASAGTTPDPVVIRSSTPALADAPSTARSEAASEPGSDTPSGSTSAPPDADVVDGPTGTCADERQLATERCALATLARGQAGSADEASRRAQAAYDDHELAAAGAALAADPRAVRRAKDEAQLRFRSGRSSAATPDALEGAARDWLQEVNRINSAAREAGVTTTREHEAATRIGATLERLALDVDVAKIAAETAEAACLAARQAVADCDEAGTEPAREYPVQPSGGDVGEDPADPLVAALGGDGTPRIFRLLRGDRDTMTELATRLADGDPAGVRRWQLGLAGLVDAIIADSIQASALDFPQEHPFWGPFTPSQDRDIAAALSSLGYRFDGLGGWSDDRMPSQRDLSLALGYAGLDPMRMRHWPTEAETADLFREVTVAAEEHLAGAAGDLTLGELVAMLGKRADGLAEVWNQWGVLRPLLLAER